VNERCTAPCAKLVHTYSTCDTYSTCTGAAVVLACLKPRPRHATRHRTDRSRPRTIHVHCVYGSARTSAVGTVVRAYASRVPMTVTRAPHHPSPHDHDSCPHDHDSCTAPLLSHSHALIRASQLCPHQAASRTYAGRLEASRCFLGMVLSNHVC
jgi:hypothetical protein